jgi:hypothetical protein
MPKIGCFVLQNRDQDFAGLRLAGRDRALDLRRLEQRAQRMDRDGELAAGRLALRPWRKADVLQVRIVDRIGARQIPLVCAAAGAAINASAAANISILSRVFMRLSLVCRCRNDNRTAPRLGMRRLALSR